MSAIEQCRRPITKNDEVILKLLDVIAKADLPLRQTIEFRDACEVYWLRFSMVGGKPHLFNYMPEKT